MPRQPQRQQYKSAKSLGIRPIDRKYFIATLHSLETIAKTDKPLPKLDGFKNVGFDMSSFASTYGCNTTACYAGWSVLHAYTDGGRAEVAELIGYPDIRRHKYQPTDTDIDTWGSVYANRLNAPGILHRLFFQHMGMDASEGAARLREWLTTGVLPD